MSINLCMDSTHSNNMTLDWKAPHRYLWPVYGFRTAQDTAGVSNAAPGKFKPVIMASPSTSELTYAALLAPLSVWNFIGHSKLPVNRQIIALRWTWGWLRTLLCYFCDISLWLTWESSCQAACVLEWLLVTSAAVWLVRTDRWDYGSTTVMLSLQQSQTIKQVNRD